MKPSLVPDAVMAALVPDAETQAQVPAALKRPAQQATADRIRPAAISGLLSASELMTARLPETSKPAVLRRLTRNRRPLRDRERRRTHSPRQTQPAARR